MGFATVVAFDSGMKAGFALGRAVSSSAGVEVGWVLLGADVAMLCACTLGRMVAKGKAFGALSVRAEG